MILVNISILEVTDIFVNSCKSNQVQYLKKLTFLHSLNFNKIVSEYTVCSIKK